MMKFLSRTLLILLILAGVGINAKALQADLSSNTPQLKSSSLKQSKATDFSIKAYSASENDNSLFISEEIDEEDKNHLVEPGHYSNGHNARLIIGLSRQLHLQEASNDQLRSKPFVGLSPQKVYLLFEVFRL